MNADIVVLAAATAVVVIAQVGIVVATRPGNLREILYLAVPSAGLAALLVFGWFSLTG